MKSGEAITALQQFRNHVFDTGWIILDPLPYNWPTAAPHLRIHSVKLELQSSAIFPPSRVHTSHPNWPAWNFASPIPASCQWPSNKQWGTSFTRISHLGRNLLEKRLKNTYVPSETCQEPCLSCATAPLSGRKHFRSECSVEFSRTLPKPCRENTRTYLEPARNPSQRCHGVFDWRNPLRTAAGDRATAQWLCVVLDGFANFCVLYLEFRHLESTCLGPSLKRQQCTKMRTMH